jgi:hypothetical protein
MNEQQNRPGKGVPDGPAQGTGAGLPDVLAEILERVLQTREARLLLAQAVPTLLKAWAGESGWRAIASKMAAGFLRKGFSRPFRNGERTIEKLFEDPVFLDRLAELTTAVFIGIEDRLICGAKTLERMPPADKKKFVTEKLAHLMQGKSGELMTRCARVMNDIQRNDPGFLSRLLAPGFAKWVESADFGELKEAVERAGQEGVALVEMAGDVIWRYPAKFILLLSFLPTFVNTLGRSIRASLSKLTEIPPDLLTDVAISLAREIDGAVIAGLVNDFAEIGRKLHTGSALLGEAGSPQLPRLFSEKLAEIVDGTDPAVFRKARTAVADVTASFKGAMADAVHRNAEHRRMAMLKSMERINIRRKNVNRRLLQFESMYDEEFGELWAQGLTGFDAQEAAEVLNNSLRLINRLWDQTPEVLEDMLFRFSSAMDDDVLAETARRIFDDAGDRLRPVARSVVPGFVTWVCHVLKPADDAYEDDASRARKALRSLLTAEEI